MIEYILGIPGSGKTYRASYLTYNTFSVDSKDRHFKNTHFFTNINEFQFDKFPEKGFKFEYDLFYSQLMNLYTMSQNGASDSELIVLAKEYNHHNALFIIDECHNIFDKDDQVLVWWLTYHRHLHQNILLLTQNLALVKPKYKSMTENFYQAVPSSRRFDLASLFGNSKFQYKHFATSRLSKSDYAGTISLDFKQEIYDLYHSGANTQSKNIVKKYAYLALGGVIAVIVLIIGVRSYWSSKYTVAADTNDTISSNAPAGSSSQQFQNGPQNVVLNVSKFPEYITVYCDSVECSNGIPFQAISSFRVKSVEIMPNLPSVRKYELEQMK